MRYIAMWNMPGCLPTMEPATFDTFNEARDYIAAELQDLMDDADIDSCSRACYIGAFANVMEYTEPFAEYCAGLYYCVEEVSENHCLLL